VGAEGTGAAMMRDESSGLEFLRFAWRERRIVILACASALAVAATVTFFLPRRYTATATILIEPPAGNDPRAATAVSTVYLESLKTYEQLVSADTLFAGAIDKLGLRTRYSDSTIEELKRKMLAVSKPVNTSLIEVSATLPNPADAQRLAQTVAQDAVTLNAALDKQANEDLVREPERLYQAAKARRERAEKAQAEFLQGKSVLSLDRQIADTEALRSQVGLDLARERSDLASFEGQRDSGLYSDPSIKELTALQAAASVARVRTLEQQQAQLHDVLSARLPEMEMLKRQQEAIENELRSARAEEETAMNRIREIQSSTGVRRVRLTLLDPGIVPQKPSFPNLALNMVVAFALALAASLMLLIFRFVRRALVSRYEEPVYSRV
jgi:uncharacterized protein involved in exopolysaccharide biosynthesis